MPRLLLVDDNPSIHRIAESLLAGSSVELVCVDSAEAALDKLNGGERFDIALLDTVMPGMDGWQLLDRIRATPALEDMPVAMMAGVLDAVDQGRLDSAPIQGFLKKPIELRDLNDRVQAILSQSSRSAFATVPGAKLEGWGAGDRDVSMFDIPALPEEAPVVADEAESDLLILGPEDLLDEPAHAAASAPTSPELVLEELDIEGLHGLPHGAPAAEGPAAEPEAAPAELGLADLGELPEAAEPEPDEPAHVAPEPVEALPAIHSMDLALVDPVHMMEPAAPSMASPAETFALPAFLEPSAPEPMAPAMAAPQPAAVPAAPDISAPAAAAPRPLPAGSLDSEALVRAIASDPALLDALVKAVVAQAGDKVLREIAWELMPELAAKLKP